LEFSNVGFANSDSKKVVSIAKCITSHQVNDHQGVASEGLQGYFCIGPHALTATMEMLEASPVHGLFLLSNENLFGNCEALVRTSGMTILNA
jgi:hypothetical protein